MSAGYSHPYPSTAEDWKSGELLCWHHQQSYMASDAGSTSTPISHTILLADMVPSLPTIRAMHALFEWEKWVDQSVNPSTGEAATKQKKAWNSLVVESYFYCLLNQLAANLCQGMGLGCRLTIKGIRSVAHCSTNQLPRPANAQRDN